MSHDDDTATLATTIKHGVEEHVKNLHTSMPGIIVKFDAKTQRASVQPAIKRVFINREATDQVLTAVDLPQLINVPVIFPRGGGFSLTFPVKSGDECLLTFCERAIDLWDKSGGVQNPITRRFHDLSDATCFVGISSLPNKINNYSETDVVLKHDGDLGSVAIDPLGKVKLFSTLQVEVIAPIFSVIAPIINLIGNIFSTGTGGGSGTASFKADINIEGNVDTQGDITSTGTVDNNTINIGSTHIHSQGDDSGTDTEVDTGNPHS